MPNQHNASLATTIARYVDGGCPSPGRAHGDRGLLGNSHDKVMQSIERLDVRGAIALPPIGDSPTPSGQISNLQMFDG